jgi:beta-lactamase class D
MSKFIIAFVACFLACQVAAKDPALAELFERQSIDGTTVISSLHSRKTFIHNDPRANLRVSPASTFKILNTLISLEENAISGKDDVLAWDGHIYAIPDWNHDQTLESAFKVSCVWCFQELARRVGAERYRRELRKADYGELHEPFEETLFWLDGSLVISATEQVDFLKKVYQRSLPFRPSSYETLQEIMVVEKTSAHTMRAKTGWAERAGQQVGWYVGYVETAKDVWFFATNIGIRDKTDLPLREMLTRQALQAKGIIE